MAANHDADELVTGGESFEARAGRMDERVGAELHLRPPFDPVSPALPTPQARANHGRERGINPSRGGCMVHMTSA
jgi:hypothetical protein